MILDQFTPLELNCDLIILSVHNTNTKLIAELMNDEDRTIQLKCLFDNSFSQIIYTSSIWETLSIAEIVFRQG